MNLFHEKTVNPKKVAKSIPDIRFNYLLLNINKLVDNTSGDRRSFLLKASDFLNQRVKFFEQFEQKQSKSWPIEFNDNFMIPVFKPNIQFSWHALVFADKLSWYVDL